MWLMSRLSYMLKRTKLEVYSYSYLISSFYVYTAARISWCCSFLQLVQVIHETSYYVVWVKLLIFVLMAVCVSVLKFVRQSSALKIVVAVVVIKIIIIIVIIYLETLTPRTAWNRHFWYCTHTVESKSKQLWDASVRTLLPRNGKIITYS